MGGDRVGGTSGGGGGAHIRLPVCLFEQDNYISPEMGQIAGFPQWSEEEYVAAILFEVGQSTYFINKLVFNIVLY